MRSFLTKKILKDVKNIWEGTWECSLGEGVNWQDIYRSLGNTPQQYRAIRYKILTRTVGTNSFLNKIELRETDSCDHCMLWENIEHKFWYCQRVRTFWENLDEWLTRNYQTPSKGGDRITEVILGGTASQIINHIISVGLYMIYSGKQLSLETLEGILQADCKSEKYWAQLNNKMACFEST